MRLTSFSVENYGNFESVGLSLDPRPGHINLIVAPNGGGKTVLRRAFRDLLFGIPSRSTMGFRFGYSGMRLLAEGVDNAGATFEFGRRKGIGNTLINADGGSLDLSNLKRLIGEADEGLFERLFALDSQLLRSGAEAMLASGGDLAEALFAAGSGVAGLRRACEEFETSRDRLAKDHKMRSLPFYRALNALAVARSDLHASTVRPKDWDELSSKLDFARRQRASLINKRVSVQAEMQRLERIKRVRPWLEQLESARQQIAASAGAPRLPADTEDRWRDARQAFGDAERERNAAKDRVKSITDAIVSDQPDSGLLEQAERIDALERARDQIAADRRDLPKREADCRQAAARVRELLAALGAKSSAEIAVILPNGPQVASARDLIKQHAALSERLRTANADASKNEPKIVAAEAELAQIGEVGDTAELAALVAGLRAHGDPTRLIADLRAKSSQEEARLGAALAKVPLWDQGLEALAAIVPPAGHMVEEAAAALDSARALLAEAERDVTRLLSKRKDATQRLADARQGKPVPDAAAIDAVRARRDRGWSLIRRNKFEGEDLKAEIATYAGSLSMTTAFERAVGVADDLADRRDEESARLAAIAEQERAASRLDDDIVDAGQRLVGAGEGHNAALRAWVTLTKPLVSSSRRGPAISANF